MRFRADQHLRRQNDIREIREKGQRLDCREFTIWWKRRDAAASEETQANGSRVCVIASTKAVGGAVQRNRAKRRLREMFRLQQQCVPPRCDLLVIARAAVLMVPLAQLEKRFAAASEQIALATTTR